MRTVPKVPLVKITDGRLSEPGVGIGRFAVFQRTQPTRGVGIFYMTRRPDRPALTIRIQGFPAWIDSGSCEKGVGNLYIPRSYGMR